MGEHALDLLGLKCPLPALRTRAALLRLAPGERLIIRASDPLAAIDIPNAAREIGDRVESCTTEDGIVSVAVLRVRPARDDARGAPP